MRRRVVIGILALVLAAPLAAQDLQVSGDSVSVRFIEADLRLVLQALGQSLAKPLLVAGVPSIRVTLQTPVPVARNAIPALLRGLVEAQGFELTEEPAFFRVAPKPPPAPPAREPLRAERDAGSAPRLHVIRLRHARAADVAATINQLFGGSGDFGARDGLGGTLSDELRSQQVPPGGAPGLRPAAEPTQPGGFTGAVTIVPDELTNALLIRASDEDLRILQQAVEELDLRPLQVLIEVLIVEARRDKSFSLGTSFLKPEHATGEGTTSSGRLQAGSSGLSELVIRLMNIGKADIDAALTLSETRGQVQIVSRPVILASNNTEARLLVGTQRPFVQVSRSLPTDAPQRDQVIQYRDVGTKLLVRPTINQDGYISLVVQQEVNSATGEVAFDAPVIATREAVTQLLVRDGQTIVIGGLNDEQREGNSSGVPVLSGIPIIGGLFGGSSRRSTRTELYLFLTPRILRSDADADSATAVRRTRLPDGGLAQ